VRLLDVVVAGRCPSVRQPQGPTTSHIYKTRGC